MKKLTLFLVLIILIIPLFAQETEVFAPFVSRLKATAEDNSIKLTWEDSEDIAGKNFIFRYTEEITNTNFSDAKRIAEIPVGLESFIDYPPDSQEYYYAVLIENEDGELFDYIIPFRNATSRGVFVETIATEEDLSATVTNISVNAHEDYISISFQSSNPTRELIVYRHTKPIMNSEELLSAQLVKTIDGSSSSFRDYPIPGVPNYYGVFDSGMIKINKFIFSPGQNISTKPVEIAITDSNYTNVGILSRSQPLPLLLINTHIGSDQYLTESLALTIPKKKEISEKTQNAVDAILANISTPIIKEPEPQVLDVDKALNMRGEQYTLSLILQNYFSKRNWEKTEEEIDDFLRIHHTDSIERRTHYYLGQTYYFQGKYEKAFLEFLMVREDYYSEVDVWLNAVYRKLKEQE